MIRIAMHQQQVLLLVYSQQQVAVLVLALLLLWLLAAMNFGRTMSLLMRMAALICVLMEQVGVTTTQ